jgi:hypothetical protein
LSGLALNLSLLSSEARATVPSRSLFQSQAITGHCSGALWLHLAHRATRGHFPLTVLPALLSDRTGTCPALPDHPLLAACDPVLPSTVGTPGSWGGGLDSGSPTAQVSPFFLSHGCWAPLQPAMGHRVSEARGTGCPKETPCPEHKIEGTTQLTGFSAHRFSLSSSPLWEQAELARSAPQASPVLPGPPTGGGYWLGCGSTHL